jgi:hypothetical protein
MWHYQQDGSQLGPIPEDDLRDLLQSKRLAADTPVWTEELGEWYPADQIENLSESPQTKAAIPSSTAPSAPQAPQRVYRYPKMWIGIVLTVLAFLILTIGLNFVDEPDPIRNTPWLVVWVAFLILIPTYVYWEICIYKLHAVLRDHTAGKYPITPRQAVGYGFIPFYHLYWMFRWTNQLVDFVNDADSSRRIRRGWPGSWLLFSELFWKFSSALSFLIKFIIGIRLTNQLRNTIELQQGESRARGACPTKGRFLMGLREKIERARALSNPAQRTIVAVAVPAVSVLLGLGLMSWLNSRNGPIDALSYGDFTSSDLEETWWAWLLVVLGVATFEFFWLGNPQAGTQGREQMSRPVPK